jgi:hypothetical protein
LTADYAKIQEYLKFFLFLFFKWVEKCASLADLWTAAASLCLAKNAGPPVRTSDPARLEKTH